MMEPNGVIRKLAAIFSADVKDYSLLMREDEVDTVRTLLLFQNSVGFNSAVIQTG